MLSWHLYMATPLEHWNRPVYNVKFMVNTRWNRSCKFSIVETNNLLLLLTKQEDKTGPRELWHGKLTLEKNQAARGAEVDRDLLRSSSPVLQLGTMSLGNSPHEVLITFYNPQDILLLAEWGNLRTCSFPQLGHVEHLTRHSEIMKRICIYKCCNDNEGIKKR